MQIKAYKLRTKSPSDISGLVDLFDRGLIKPEEVISQKKLAFWTLRQCENLEPLI